MPGVSEFYEYCWFHCHFQEYKCQEFKSKLLWTKQMDRTETKVTMSQIYKMQLTKLIFSI